MAYTNYIGDGVAVNGAPLIPGGGNAPIAPIYFYVNSVGGSNGGDGSMSNPFATLAFALTQCVASKGYTILLMPGHAETVIAAGTITCSVAGVNIVGLGTGSNRPVFTFSTAASASVLISAANVSISNIVGVSAINALTQPFDIRAAGCTLGLPGAPVEWQDPSSALQAVRQVLTTAAADNLSINMRVSGVTSGGTSPVNCIRLVGCDIGRIFLDFYGRASTSVVEFVTTACTGIEVYGYIYNSGVTNYSKNVVDTVTGSTWYASYDDGAAGAPITSGSAAQSSGATDLQERVALKSAATITNGQTLFTVAGGPIKIEALVSICVTGNDATASTLQYSVTPTSGSATTISGASASLASALAGASVTLAGTALATAALLNANGPGLIANPGTIMAPAGTITAVVAVGSTTGTWRHYIRYKPLAAGVTVT